ncbi:MAG TPA: serine hydrolase [Thermoanaerobaculia bacterium]|nr:serine hydrolase [Thermoanaerobaculia bacterium]
MTPLAALVAAALAAAGPPGIQDQVAAKVKAFHGEMGVYAKDLATGEVIAVNADQRFPTASLIKVAVMAEVFRQMSESKFAKTTPVTLRNEDKAGDETVPLNMLHDGTVLTVGDLLHFMIAYSDNTATNLLLGLVGTANVDRLLDSYGLTKTRLYRPTFRDGHPDVLPEEEKEYGLGSTTPREAATLMALIAEGKVVSRAACDDMLALLAQQQDRAMIPRSLPFEKEEIFVANKTGWDEEKRPDAKGFKGDVRNDAAYVKGPKARYVIAICARRIADKSPGVDSEALRSGGEISKLIYDAFSGKAPSAKPAS